MSFDAVEFWKGFT